MDNLPYPVQAAFPLLFLVVPAVGALITVRRGRTGRTPAETWQRWWGIGALGIGSIWMTFTFVLMPQAMADTIGFTASPFQFEIAFANLGLALMGFRAASASPRERLTLGIASAAFLWGAIIGHLDQWFAHGDRAPGNTGGILVNDLLIPLVVILLAARDLRRGRGARDRVGAEGAAAVGTPRHSGAR